MDYKEQEAVQKLNSIIKLFQRKQELSEGKEWDGDIQWVATYLFSKILLRANRNTCYFSREELENFKSLFEQKNNTSIDLNLLFSNYWLREILGFIHLPDAVRVVTNDFEKYQSNFLYYSHLFALLQIKNSFQTQFFHTDICTILSIKLIRYHLLVSAIKFRIKIGVFQMR